jgi:hypothetical protein
MIGRRNYIEGDWLFALFKFLLALAIIFIFGYLFCKPPSCY